MLLPEIIVPEPSWNSPLVESIFRLERLRYSGYSTTTPPWLFFDIKRIMQVVESVLSVRIEGNRTTLFNAVEDVLEGQKPTKDEQIIEYRNIQKAIEFIENNVSDRDIDRSFLSELHKIVVRNVPWEGAREGSQNPGEDRSINVRVGNNLVPPIPASVAGYMEELYNFINKPRQPYEDLIATALAHHRFEVIHPFDNGNGRVGRLLTYAMLTKQGYIDTESLMPINPSAIFGTNRSLYYQKLGDADKGSNEGIISWCSYVVEGIEEEVSRIDRLMDFEYMRKRILSPTIKVAHERGLISNIEKEVLDIATSKPEFFQAGDVIQLFGVGPSGRTKTSRALRKMRETKLISTLPDKKQQYVPRFFNKSLLRGVMQQLDEQRVLPLKFEPGINL